jgi:hypothetical protein
MVAGGLAFIAVRSKLSKRQASLLHAAEAERAKIQNAKKRLKKR